ncbi:MAG: FKBP-type peptidyl-prolyl cis-trans isomerase [Pseudomonadota bacterium]
MNKAQSLLNLLAISAALLLPLAPASADDSSAVKTLTKIDSKVGTGAEAVPGKEVSVHYTGWLYSAAKPDHKGNKFDSSVDRGQPFNFPLGGGQVIAGWDQGVAGMKVGGKRTLIIPPAMGYGARGAGGAIPPNAALVFDVELLKIQ